MQMNDSQRIPAPKEKVWAALNDPEILKQCIPGCQSLDMSSPTEMTATVVFKVGPVKATFGGKVTLSDLDPPNSYRISGEGSGGVAGFAKGGATVRLERGRARRDGAALRRRRADRRQARPTRRAADQFHREETGGRILCFVWTSCWRSCGGSCGSGAQGLVGQADWRGLATVVGDDCIRRSRVARMSVAKCGDHGRRRKPGFRSAHPGYDCCDPELYRARLTCQTSLQVLQQRPAKRAC